MVSNLGSTIGPQFLLSIDVGEVDMYRRGSLQAAIKYCLRHSGPFPGLRYTARRVRLLMPACADAQRKILSEALRMIFPIHFTHESRATQSGQAGRRAGRPPVCLLARLRDSDDFSVPALPLDEATLAEWGPSRGPRPPGRDWPPSLLYRECISKARGHRATATVPCGSPSQPRAHPHPGRARPRPEAACLESLPAFLALSSQTEPIWAGRRSPRRLRPQAV